MRYRPADEGVRADSPNSVDHSLDPPSAGALFLLRRPPLTMCTNYELSSDFGSRDHTRRCSSDRFHGNNASRSEAARPPDSAHAVRYAVSQARGLSPHNDSVWNSEKSIAANWPLQTAPEP